MSLSEESKRKQASEADADINMDDALNHSVYDDAISLVDVNPTRAAELFRSILNETGDSQALIKVKEESIAQVAKLLAKKNDIAALKQLFVDIRPFFTTIPKSRTAKIVRNLIDVVGDANGSLQSQIEICQDAIAWATQEKRTFLKQRIQARLAAAFVKNKQYNDALPLVSRLIREVKKFDDKLLLVEVYLVESRAHLALQNIPKAKGALTAARSSANAIYCPPLLQAEIDLQAGILCNVEGDYKTAYSYFYEAFEGYNTMKDAVHAVKALKYMLLGKIMNNQYEDVYSVINGKAGVKYAGVEIEAMRHVTDAYKARSIQKFESVFTEYADQLAKDPLISTHLFELKDKLLESNLLRLLEPFSRVQIVHVSKLIRLPLKQVEEKLSQMILDKKLQGILDQGTGDLILFENVLDNSNGNKKGKKDPSQESQDKEENKKDPLATYKHAESAVKELNSVVDRLYGKAKQLTR